MEFSDLEALEKQADRLTKNRQTAPDPNAKSRVRKPGQIVVPKPPPPKEDSEPDEPEEMAEESPSEIDSKTNENSHTKTDISDGVSALGKDPIADVPRLEVFCRCIAHDSMDEADAFLAAGYKAKDRAAARHQAKSILRKSRMKDRIAFLKSADEARMKKILEGIGDDTPLDAQTAKRILSSIARLGSNTERSGAIKTMESMGMLDELKKRRIPDPQQILEYLSSHSGYSPKDYEEHLGGLETILEKIMFLTGAKPAEIRDTLFPPPEPLPPESEDTEKLLEAVAQNVFGD